MIRSANLISTLKMFLDRKSFKKQFLVCRNILILMKEDNSILNLEMISINFMISILRFIREKKRVWISIKISKKLNYKIVKIKIWIKLFKTFYSSKTSEIIGIKKSRKCFKNKGNYKNSCITNSKMIFQP